MNDPNGATPSAAAALVSGRALHTGVASTIRVSLRPDDGLGIRFLFPGFARPLTGRDLAALRRSARRSTVLESPATGATIRTPEHLLAAALFFARAPLDIACDAPEPPGLDGSARPWFTALAAAAPAEYAAAPREYNVEIGATGWRHEGPEGSIVAEPAESFSVEYLVERGDFRQSFRLESAGAAAAEIFPARTFIFWKDWSAASDAHPQGSGELLSGAGANSGLLLAESEAEFMAARASLAELRGNTFPLLHPEAFRLPDEAARHKVLDLLGDLALAGGARELALPRLRLTVRNGGHALNHRLLDHLEVSRPSRRTTD